MTDPTSTPSATDLALASMAVSALNRVIEAETPVNPFATVGPSAEFMNTHPALPGMSLAQAKELASAAKKAIDESDVAKIKKIAAGVKGFLGELGGLLAL